MTRDALPTDSTALQLSTAQICAIYGTSTKGHRYTLHALENASVLRNQTNGREWAIDPTGISVRLGPRRTA